MKLIKELLLYPLEVEENHCYLFTSNHTCKNNGDLVMGRGNALAFKLAYPEAPTYLGKEIKNNPSPIIAIPYGKGGIGSFQTKEHWRNPSTEALIQTSTNMLLKYATDYPHWTFHLPYPAIGNGGLTREIIEPIISILPDNVLIYIKE